MGDLARETGVELSIPSPILCTDNAAMLAVPADYYLRNGIRSGLQLDAKTVWSLDSLAERVKD